MAGITLVQTGTLSSAIGTVSLIMPNPFTAGNLLVLGFGGNFSLITYGTVSDNLANNYQKIFGLSDPTTHDLEMYYVGSLIGGQGTISVTNNGLHVTNMIAREYSGLSTSPLDQQGTLDGATGTVANSGTTPTTTQGSELAVMFALLGGTVTSQTFDVTYSDGTLVNQSLALLTQDKILSTTGQQVGTLTYQPTHTFAAGIATFQTPSAASQIVGYKSLLGVGQA